MEASPSTTDRVGTIRSSKWAMGIMAMLLSASLILSACGGSEGAGTDPTLSDPAGGDVPVVPDEGGIDDTEGITE
jgi:hypothetical protein